MLSGVDSCARIENRYYDDRRSGVGMREVNFECRKKGRKKKWKEKKKFTSIGDVDAAVPPSAFPGNAITSG